MAFDVILFHAVYRIIISALLHRTLAKRLLKSWFTWSSEQFRFSEFMLGRKRIEEEGDGVEAAREYRQLRVPNHDRVQVIPGVRMMIPALRGMGLFGRPGETPEEVASRWRLVYFPAFFFRRIILFIVWHWTSLVAASSIYFVLPRT
jgi:hypothetical protein